MSGVYNRILDAFDKFLKNNGTFHDSVEVEKALEEYRYSNSVYNQFADACIFKGKADDFISTDELMIMYKQWADINNIQYRPSNNKLFKELRGIGVITVNAEPKRMQGNKIVRVFYGITKKQEEF